MHLLEPTVQMWMKIDPYYQRQICMPMNLVSENIRFIGIFAGVPLGGSVKWQWGCRRRQFFGDLYGYFFGNVWNKTSNIKWRYATSCLPVTDCKMNDIEWPWVPISRQNPFSTSKAVARLPLHQLGFLVSSDPCTRLNCQSSSAH